MIAGKPRQISGDKKPDMFPFLQKEEAPTLDRRQSLAGVPVLHNFVTIDRSDENNWVLTLRIPKRNRGFLARFQPDILTRRVRLDELGSFVVARINGETTVMEIINDFASRFKTNRRETELSVVQFLKSLVSRQAISIVIK